MLLGVVLCVSLWRATTACEWEVREIPRLTVKEVQDVEYFQDNWSQLPVIITGAVDELEGLLTFDYLRKCGGTMPVYRTTTSGKKLDEWAGLKYKGEIPMAEFVDEMLKQTPEDDAVGYGFDYIIRKHCPAIEDMITLPDIFQGCLLDRIEQNKFTWPSLMAGPNGTRSDLHVDNCGLPFWMALAQGKKHWRVLPPVENKQVTRDQPRNTKLWPATEKGVYEGLVLEDYMNDGNGYEFKGFDPDFERFPNLCKAVVYEAVLSAGEVIYIPNKAPHGAQNLSPTIAVTWNYLAPHDKRQMEWAVKICADGREGKHYAELDESICKQLTPFLEEFEANEAAAEAAAAATAAAQVKKAMALIKGWSKSSPIPQRDFVSKWLNEYPLVTPGNEDTHAHTKPIDVFETPEQMEQVVGDIGAMLRRGLNRFVRSIERVLESVETSNIDFVLLNARSVIKSFEIFWHQVILTVKQGPDQLEELPEWGEYGPETNFWLHFRPSLSCHHTARIGPELGGVKSWCNPEYFVNHPPRFVLSGGCGVDVLFEDLVLANFKETKVVTADCFIDPNEIFKMDSDRDLSRLVGINQCLSDNNHDDDALYPPHVAAKFLQFDDFMANLIEKHDIDYFDLHKVNIEAYEYPVYGFIMQDPDKYMAHTKQIQMEVHRKGMQKHGLSWASLMYLELFLATMYSGGFHPVYTEKWHDSNAAQDMVFVNQTWFIESELEAYKNIWTAPLMRRSVESDFFGRSKDLWDQYDWISTADVNKILKKQMEEKMEL